MPISASNFSPAFIPDCTTDSPFSHRFPPPALNPSSAFPIVFVDPPIDTFPPAFALMSLDSFLDFALDIFRFPLIFKSIFFFASTFPPRISTFSPDFIDILFLDIISELVYTSEFLVVTLTLALPPTPISAFPPHNAL